MPDTKRSILSHISYYSIALFLSEALFFVRGFLLARIFGPALFGLWTEMKLALIFLQYARFGTNEAMMREIPYAVGRGNNEYANEIKKTVFSFNILSSGFVAVILFALVIFFKKTRNFDISSLWAYLAIIFFVSQMYWAIIIKFQAEKRFGQYSKRIFGFALCSTVVGLIFAHFFSLPGFLLALAISYFAMIIYSRKNFLSFPLFAGNISLLQKLIKTGLPIMISGALLIILWNTDKLIIWLLMTKKDLGIYAIQSYIANLVMLVPVTVSAVLYPNVMESFGKTQIPSKLEKCLTRPTLIMSYLACPLLGILLLSLHLPIKWLLPKYLPAIIPGQILILAFFFMVIAKMPATLLVSLNKQNLLLVLTGLSVLVGVVADYLLIKSGKGIIGVALGTSLSFVVYSTLTMLASLRALKISLYNSVSFISLVVTPYLAVILLITIVLQLFPETDTGLASDFLFTSIRCLMIIVPMGFVFYLSNQRFCFVKLSALKGGLAGSRPVKQKTF